MATREGRVHQMRRGKEITDEGVVEAFGKDKDTLHILIQLVAFGSKRYADVVFEDKMPIKVKEILPSQKHEK
jgi:hypothetical protein